MSFNFFKKIIIIVFCLLDSKSIYSCVFSTATNNGSDIGAANATRNNNDDRHDAADHSNEL